MSRKRARDGKGVFGEFSVLPSGTATVIATAVDVGITVLLVFAFRGSVYTSKFLALELVDFAFPLNTICYLTSFNIDLIHQIAIVPVGVFERTTLCYCNATICIIEAFWYCPSIASRDSGLPAKSRL